jgi:uridine kinase
MFEFLLENRVARVYCGKRNLLKEFDRSKIELAILKAGEAVGGLAQDMDQDSVLWRMVVDPNENRDQVLAAMLTNVVISDLNANPDHCTAHHPPHIDFVHDRVIEVLRDWGFPSVSNAYSIYREGKKCVRLGLLKPEEFLAKGMPEARLQAARQNYARLGISTIEDLNRQIAEGHYLDLVKAETERYEAEIRVAVEAVSQRIREKPNQNFVVLVAGPSSSGKTTTSLKIQAGIKAAGAECYYMGGDDYFFDKRTHPLDVLGDFNFEIPQSINIVKLEQHLRALLNGEEITPPRYDFQTKVVDTEHKARIRNGVIVLDCLHGLYITRLLGVDALKVYIEAISPFPDVKHTDIRILRRMTRDVWNRGYPIDETLEHWRTVRKGEFKGIIPFQKSAHFHINGDVAYGLPALKYYLTQVQKYDFDPRKLEKYRKQGRIDVYKRGVRVFDIVNRLAIPSLEEIRQIPKDNLIREFISNLGLEEESKK